jgi:hypothetical protein
MENGEKGRRPHHGNLGRLSTDKLIEVDLFVLQEVKLSSSPASKPEGDVLRRPVHTNSRGIAIYK